MDNNNSTNYDQENLQQISQHEQMYIIIFLAQIKPHTFIHS